MIVYPARDIRPFVMYCVNGKPRSSLLIESSYRLYDTMYRVVTRDVQCVLYMSCTWHVRC